MKSRKSKKRTQQASPYNKHGILSSMSGMNIKFDMTKSNLSCFIGEKRQNKKTVPKRSQSIKTRKPSEKKKPLNPIEQPQVDQKPLSKKRL